MSLAAADPVKAQNPRVLIQVDADPPGLGRAQQLFLTVVPEGEAGPGPVQAPGEGVVTQAAQVVGAFPLHFLVSHPDRDLCRRKGGSMVARLPDPMSACTWWIRCLVTLWPVHSTSQ